jgi:hypothetical protein
MGQEELKEALDRDEDSVRTIVTEAYKKIMKTAKSDYDEWGKQGTKEVTPDLIRSIMAPLTILSEFMRDIIPDSDEV